jgi:hypothetical protein
VVNPVAGVATFSLSFGAVTTCTLTATSTFNGFAYTTGPVVFKVYQGVLSCSTATFSALAIPAYDANDPSTFRGSPSGVLYDSETAFIEGARGLGDPAKGDDCSKDINFEVKNNIAGSSGNLVDVRNNQVPPNGWSFVWDETVVPNPVVGVITTYKSEWGDPVTGLPTRQTKVCTVTPCPGSEQAFPAAWKVLTACIGTTVTHASIPAGERACLARETWTVIPLGDPYYCTSPAPATPPGVPPRCLQPTAITIIGEDPVFIR